MKVLLRQLVELLRSIFQIPFYDSYIPREKPKSVEGVSAAFKLAFLTVLLLTVASAAAATLIAFVADEP